MTSQKGKRNYAAEILKIVNDAKKEHSEMSKQLKYFDDEYNDLTHALEFLKLNAAELVIKAGEIKKNRVNRRICKESLELHGGFITWCNDRVFDFNELKRLSNMTEACKKHQGTRVYTPRVHTELTKRFRKDIGR